jgi:pimeloyl-ACP methyl ester carboxylesterase
VERASEISDEAGTTGIYLARIGVNGSSGHHRLRKTMLELHIMNGALDALKERHRYEGFHLVGNSGGSALIAGLLTLRDDVGCAVLGSAPLSGRDRELRGTPARQRLHPEDWIAEIARKRSARILVVTDPKDTVVSARRQQEPFVRAVASAGGQIRQYFVRLPERRHHSVQAYSFYVVGACVQNQSDRQIESGLKEIEYREFTKARRGGT